MGVGSPIHMQALVGLFCFSLLLAAGTCLECEHCSGFKEDCSGKLELCSEGQDTCATILTETIIGKVSSFTIVKSCYQASKCLRSSNGNSPIKVNVDIECSSSPAGKMERGGGKASAHWRNELPDNQHLPEVFKQAKSRAAGIFGPNAGKRTARSNLSADLSKPTNPPTQYHTQPPTEKLTQPTTKKNPKPTTPKTPKPATQKPTEATTPGAAHQTLASFLLTLSSLLLMNILL